MPGMDFPESGGCDNPTCESGDSSNEYIGPNGNSLMVCNECYWDLVTGGEVDYQILHGTTPPLAEHIDTKMEDVTLPDEMDDRDVNFSQFDQVEYPE